MLSEVSGYIFHSNGLNLTLSEIDCWYDAKWSIWLRHPCESDLRQHPYPQCLDVDVSDGHLSGTTPVLANLLDNNVGSAYLPSRSVAKLLQDFPFPNSRSLFDWHNMARGLTGSVVSPQHALRNMASGLTGNGFSPQHAVWCRGMLRPEINLLHPVHSLMLVLLLFFLSDVNLSTFTSELFVALFTILVLYQ